MDSLKFKNYLEEALSNEWLGKKTNYLLHEHHAKKAGMHGDLRIEFPWTCPDKKSVASFALPKFKLPKNPGDRVVCFRTPDHPRSWATMKKDSKIEAGYGAGTFKIAQRGVLILLKWKKHKEIEFFIPNGNKLKGIYTLIEIYPSKDEKPATYFFIKNKNQNLKEYKK